LGVRPAWYSRRNSAEHALLVLGREVHHLEVDADDVAAAATSTRSWREEQYSVVVIVLPVLHEQADDLPALLLEQHRRDRGIHPARHADNHGFWT
jgi:hypothetical protein